MNVRQELTLAFNAFLNDFASNILTSESAGNIAADTRDGVSAKASVSSGVDSIPREEFQWVFVETCKGLVADINTTHQKIPH